MGDAVTAQGLKRIAALLAILTVLSMIYYRFSPGYAQSQKLAVAKGYEEELQARIDGDSRFERVLVVWNIQENDEDTIGVEISGRVYSAADFNALKQAIVIPDEIPPVPVWWTVSAPTGKWLDVHVDIVDTNAPVIYD